MIFPLAAPALFTTAILVFLASWNEYLLSSVLYNGNDNVAPSRIEDTFFFFMVAFSFFRHRKNYPSHCGLADVPSNF